ncbi:hypothetical protein I4U23_015658 [Adineta vaga]|nr:hypothetical protein I4U23_015658 [Adineta vaga]
MSVAHQYLFNKLKFDLYDLIVYFLPIYGHGVYWYCYIQSSCMSAEYATAWNCYIAFEYRIFNYIFVSYVNFVLDFRCQSNCVM